ncbi:MAG: zinc ribbon domain-containing protein [Roseiflexaceae bacterium]|nr:zinc ribbon domain-containing protein [Roseiflexaceae bacterium]
MVERVCPACQHGNPLENHFCGQCGQSLEQQLPAVRQPAALLRASAALPVPWKQVGKTVAIGLATLAAEAGVAWLRRKAEHVNLPAVPATAPTRALATTRPSQPASDAVTVVSQRVLEVWEQGDLTRKVVERTFWRKERE